jgi:hypothetical protein
LSFSFDLSFFCSLDLCSSLCFCLSFSLASTFRHSWNPDKDDDGNWIVPTTTAIGTKVDLNIKDDPICLSTGCETRPANPYNDEAWKKIGYSPLDTPLEEDMQASLASNKQAIKETGKEWSILQT